MTAPRVNGFKASTADIYQAVVDFIAVHGYGPTYACIARRTGWSEPTIGRALDSLESCGYLHRWKNNDSQGLTVTDKVWPGETP